MPKSKLADADHLPLVTVVVIVRDGSRFVVEALESVRAQSYGPLELVVIDDSSSDGSFAAAKAWANSEGVQDRFVRIVMERNSATVGTHASINRGLKLARGDWLSVLEAHGRYHPERIRRLEAAARAAGAHLLFTGVRVIDEREERRLQGAVAARLEALPDLAAGYPSLSFALLKANIVITAANLFFSRHLQQQIGGFRPLTYCHAWDFALRACLRSEPALLEEQLLDYRLRYQELIAERSAEAFLDMQAMYRSYFLSCANGNCRNPQAAGPRQWPGLYERMIADDPHLSAALQMAGSSHAQYDQIARAMTAKLGRTTWDELAKTGRP